jgi:hypothetical protein
VLTYMSTLQMACGEFDLGDGLGAVDVAMTDSEKQSSLVIDIGTTSAMFLGDAVVVKSIGFTRQLRYDGIIPEFPRRYDLKHHWHTWVDSGMGGRDSGTSRWRRDCLFKFILPAPQAHWQLERR